MGRDKALLPFKGRTLVECVASEVHAVTGVVTLVGNINRLSYLSYPVIEDIFPGRGPFSGIQAALTVSRAEWNLIVACDMPEVTSDFLRKIVERAKGILQKRQNMTEEEAYLRMRNESRRLRRPMKDLADAIILSEEMSRKETDSTAV